MVDPIEPDVVDPGVDVPGVVVDGIGVMVLGVVDVDELPIEESIDELELPIDPAVELVLLALPLRDFFFDLLCEVPFCIDWEFIEPLWPIEL